jgi:hypothetical protein
MQNLDQEQADALRSWFVTKAEVLNSIATNHATKLVAQGIATTSRLAKKLSQNPTFLVDCGFSVDDSNEIIIALKK